MSKKLPRSVRLPDYIAEILKNAVYEKGEQLDVIVAEAADLPWSSLWSVWRFDYATRKWTGCLPKVPIDATAVCLSDKSNVFRNCFRRVASTDMISSNGIPALQGTVAFCSRNWSMTISEKIGRTFVVLLSLAQVVAVRADDWPQWRGPNRDGVWNETGILEKFPAGGLKVRWHAPVGIGFSSPVVAGGRVFVTDSELAKPKCASASMRSTP